MFRNPRPALIAAALALAGCAPQSQVPLATTYPQTVQQRMEAAHHWDVLAEDVAIKVQKALESYGNRPLYITSANPPTAFNHAFRELLITRLVDMGLDVRECSDLKICLTQDRMVVGATGNALALDFNTQVIKYNDRGYIRPTPGTYTVLAAGVLAATATGVNPDAWAAVGLAAAAAADAGAGHLTSETNTEIIINVSLQDSNRYVSRLSGIYYINDNGADHYQYKAPAPTKTIHVVN